MQLSDYFVSHFRGIKVLSVFVIEVVNRFGLYPDFSTVNLDFLELVIDRFVVLEIPVNVIDNRGLEQCHQLFNLFLLPYIRHNVHVLSVNHF